MAKVIQMVATNPNDRHFAGDLVNDLWHLPIATAGPRTLCGIQLDGDDGVAGGDEKEGRVTCLVCQGTIREIKAIRNW